MTQRNVAILLFNDVEVLDFAGPFEVFSVTSELNEDKPFLVYTVAEKNGSIQAKNGLSVNPKYTLTDCPSPDILIVPGGKGSREAMKQSTILDWIKTCSQDAELVLSVCTGSLILAKAGLLEGLRATTHYQAVDLLREIAPNTEVVENQRFVEQDKIITSGGISAGIDSSLYVVAKLLGQETAIKTAQYMEYHWTHPL
ncbi:DJ-1/PfpI family protein [Lyngbya aestuarii BL J]|uniref:DJ-1/PfpI family protein n=1 Tax=Lyngbya aestuarii BL J TaxID=1348334 RepID=U7QE67_9CYAN|nr:DJ-1/PfpI family protein [Lyngbya aestuarii]ERT05340.1 DJ-1/PfpI family protein [Lyngbya aestuarii BL J]